MAFWEDALNIGTGGLYETGKGVLSGNFGEAAVNIGSGGLYGMGKAGTNIAGDIMDPGPAFTGPSSRAASAPGAMTPEQQKLADMRMIANAYQARRPEVEQARMNALAMQSRAMQPVQNAMATLYGGRGPSSALPNGMRPGEGPRIPPGAQMPPVMGPQGPQQIPQNGVRMPAPGAFGRPGMPSPMQMQGMRPPPGPMRPGMPVPPTRPGAPMPQSALPNGMPPRPQLPPPGASPGPMPPPPGTGPGGVTMDPTGMFNSPLPPGMSRRY